MKNENLYKNSKNKFNLQKLNWFWLLFTLILVDYTSKKIIFKYLAFNSVVYIFHFLNFTYLRNTGIAFGFLTNPTKLQLSFIYSVNILILLMLIHHFIFCKNKLLNFAYVVLLGGIISNLLDRILHNTVIDFISLHFCNIYLPVFNLADVFIVIGITILLYE